MNALFKYRHLFLSLLLVMLGYAQLSGQSYMNRFYVDKVWLKDSTTYEGWIIEQKVGEHVKLELLGGSVLVIPRSDIYKITRENTPYPNLKQTINYRSSPLQFMGRSPYFAVSSSIMFHRNEWLSPQPVPQLHLKGGYRLENRLGFAGGLGVEFYQLGWILPVFGEVHYAIQQKRIAPFVMAQGGYAFGMATTFWQAENLGGGPMFRIGAGFRIYTRTRMSYDISVGLRHQEISFDSNPNPWDWNPDPTAPLVRITRRYNMIGVQGSFNF